MFHHRRGSLLRGCEATLASRPLSHRPATRGIELGLPRCSLFVLATKAQWARWVAGCARAGSLEIGAAYRGNGRQAGRMKPTDDMARVPECRLLGRIFRSCDSHGADRRCDRTPHGDSAQRLGICIRPPRERDGDVRPLHREGVTNGKPHQAESSRGTSPHTMAHRCLLPPASGMSGRTARATSGSSPARWSLSSRTSSPEKSTAAWPCS